MPVPSPELTWLSIIASFVAVVGAVVNLLLIWRNRRRIQIKTVTALIYYEPWTQGDIDQVTYNPSRGPVYWITAGDCKRTFIVLEFAIKNEYPADVTVGRFVLGGWIFSNHYTRGMYDYLRDYRVFDLYGQNPIGLDSFWKIPAKSSIGFRVEILEYTDGPNWKSSHSHYIIHLPKAYKLDYLLDGSKRNHRVKFSSPRKVIYPDLSYVHHWSDLLEHPSKGTADGAPLPQGVEPPTWRAPWHLQIRNWFSLITYRLRLHWKSIRLAVSKRLK